MIFGFFRRKGSQGETTKKSGFLKKSTIGIAALFLIGKVKFYATRTSEFEKKVKLVFPNYSQESIESKKVQIVSENQLEHMIKLCNIYSTTIRCVNDHADSSFKGNNLYLDYSKFDRVKKININTQKCKLEPGATFSLLNQTLAGYGFYLPYVIPELNENTDFISVDQAVQENRLCLQSLKYGSFKESALERVGLVTGEGRMIQTGGYKVRDNYSFGFNINDLFAGSNYTIGLLFEVVVNCVQRQPHARGRTYTK